MGAIKILISFFCLLTSFIVYPKEKEKIYIEYNSNSNTKKVRNKYLNENGISFYYNYNIYSKLFCKEYTKIDTFNINLISKYKIISLNTVFQKNRNWINKKFKKYKKKPIGLFFGNRIFDTYIIEKISETQFVVYPVIWREDISL